MSGVDMIKEMRALQTPPGSTDDFQTRDSAKHILDRVLSKGEYVQGCPKGIWPTLLPITKQLVDFFNKHGFCATYDETDTMVIIQVTLT